MPALNFNLQTYSLDPVPAADSTHRRTLPNASSPPPAGPSAGGRHLGAHLPRPTPDTTSGPRFDADRVPPWSASPPRRGAAKVFARVTAVVTGDRRGCPNPDEGLVSREPSRPRPGTHYASFSGRVQTGARASGLPCPRRRRGDRQYTDTAQHFRNATEQSLTQEGIAHREKHHRDLTQA
ncbi:hypothetical protein NL676_012602 [Syzygium grande]|nr:hypothetical protein NL676_012602 [Syzygium grande]